MLPLIMTRILSNSTTPEFVRRKGNRKCRPRIALSLFVILVLVGLTPHLALTVLGACLPYEYASRICDKPVSPDGLIHITVDMSGGESRQELIQRALDA